MVSLVFFVIMGTVAFYGLLATPLARRLGVGSGNPDGILFAGADDWIRKIAKALHDSGHAVMLVDTKYRIRRGGARFFRSWASHCCHSE